MVFHKVLYLDWSFSPCTCLGDILCQCGIYFDCSADDTRLCLSMKPEETEELVKPEACFKDIKSLMTSNVFLFHLFEIEVIVLFILKEQIS